MQFKQDPKLEKLLEDIISDNSDLHLVNLCTTDGFDICTLSQFGHEIEPDKLSAIISTLGALSDSCAKQIINQEFQITTIETQSANMLIISTSYLDYKCVLSLAIKDTTSLANARFIAKRLANNIANI